MKIITNILYLLSIISAAFLTSCSGMNEEQIDVSDRYPMVIYAGISENSRSGSRALITETDDKWSYTDFTDGDTMGFYSSSGNWNNNEGKGSFNNLKLTYGEDERFTSEDGYDFSPTELAGSELYMYFPYNDRINNEGVKLRIKPDEIIDGNTSDTLRCMDFLYCNSLIIQGKVNNQDVALYGSFKHGFSELIITRGKGFNNPPSGKERITAVLSEPYTRIKVETVEDPWSCTPVLTYDENDIVTAREGITNKLTARSWDAWWGDNYHTSKEDVVGVAAWYVIVPTLPDANSVVQYIELYDNEGELRQISSLKLRGGNSKYVEPGWRYPMEATMEELVPTINPFPIEPWGENVDLTDERTRGISNITEFALWLQTYNTYLADKSSEGVQATLKKYGDLYDDGKGNKQWHFYILNDLDFSNFSLVKKDNDVTVADDGNFIIPKLEDILDGISNTLENSVFVNHKLTGLSSTFVNQLTGGTLQNIDFYEPEIIMTEITTPVGIMTNSMKNAKINNCNIEKGKLVAPNAPAGMITGEITESSIENCILSGFIVAKSMGSEGWEKVSGKNPSGNCTSNNINSDAVTPSSKE